MDNCPVCKSQIDNKFDYCLKCAWEFEYYFDELNGEGKKKYQYRLNIQKQLYLKSSKEYMIGILEKEKNDLYEELNQLKKEFNSRKTNFLSKFISKSKEVKDTVIIDGLMYQNHSFNQFTWQEAKRYAKNLKLGGYNNWRLPTKNELKKLATKNKDIDINKYYRNKFHKTGIGYVLCVRNT